jgi:hypothetical protein
MSVTIDLPPEIEVSLAAQDAARGVPLAEYLRRLLAEQADAVKAAQKTLEERVRLWRDVSGASRHEAALRRGDRAQPSHPATRSQSTA